MATPILGGLFMAATAAAVLAPTVTATTTFVVNKIGDAADNNVGNGKCDTSTASGKQCTLRAAIQEADATSGIDTINFDITSTSKVIAPGTPLPAITEKVTIDGYTQSGAKPNTLAVGTDAVLKVVLDGVNAGPTAVGLDLQSGGAVVKGLNIQRFVVGIRIGGTDNNPDSNIVRGNYIGTNAAGTQARSNLVGIRIERSDALIGGIDAAARNVISGNEEDGVKVTLGVNHTTIWGNYIGTTAAGNAALGNGGAGILIDGGTDAAIGGLSAAQRNVISSNSFGITLAGSNSSGTHFVLGNYIGTKADGTGNLGNNGDGILISGSDFNLIGTGLVGAGNLIANNGLDGIALTNGSSGNNISHNVITANTSSGIYALSGPNGIAANQIFSNALDGIRVSLTVLGIDIGGNQMIGNGELGIDLLGGIQDSFGVTANDNGDLDDGANRLQNYPVLTLARRDLSDGTAIVRGTLNSAAGTQFRIDIYLAAVDGSGHGEGQTLVASGTVTTDSGGNKTFTFTINSLTVGQVVTATATAVTSGNTSEFSANKTVTLVP